MTPSSQYLYCVGTKPLGSHHRFTTRNCESKYMKFSVKFRMCLLEFFLKERERRNKHNFEGLRVCQKFPTLTLCLVGWNLGRIENIGRKIGQKTEFSSVWEQIENRKGGKPGRKFSLPGPQIFSSQIGRKSHERKLPHCTFTIMPSLNAYNNLARQNITTGKPNSKSSQTHHKIIKIVLNLDPNSSNPYTNSYK